MTPDSIANISTENLIKILGLMDNYTMNEKILILGDIHGRTYWKDIIEKESPDMSIFLGDYVSTHEKISSDTQIYNLLDILDYKDLNEDKVILLRGNHDLQHLGYWWAECSGFDRKVYEWMSQPLVKERFLENTQWMYVIDDYIISHAGISEEWLKYYNIDFNNINHLPPSEQFSFTPRKMSDYYGISDTQPLTWIRPTTLVECAYGQYNQIVGHTRPNLDITNEPVLNMNNNKKLYLCDTLPNMYLVMTKEINNYKITYKKYE